MTPAEYAKVKDVFAKAIRLGQEERELFLHSECDSDSDTYREVVSLLQHHQNETILERQDPTMPSMDVHQPSKVDPFIVLSDVWEENRQILRHRLVIIAAVMAAVIAVSMLRLATYHTLHWGYGSRVVAIAISLAVAGLLRYKRDVSIRGLRIAELVVMANVGILILVVYVRAMLDLAAQGDEATLINTNDWHFIAWTLVIFVYGVFMPNTWQRAAAVLFPVAAIPMITTFVISYFRPGVMELLRESDFGQPIPTPFIAAAIATYAAHTIHGAQVTAYKARRLAQYRILRLIGEGGMGQVYEAEHLLLKRACAVKLIQPVRSSDDRALRRFQREVRATARLTHPHTIEVYDYGKTKDGIFFFAMELLPGMNLRELVRVAGPLPPSRAVHFLIQVCEALTEAHDAGMIHRDLKPANVFASQRGGIYDFSKLLDFGVVREIQVDANVTITSKLVAGTPSYMSPEQATTPLQIDGRSDLYSLASVGYYLLTGRAPFIGESPMQVMMAQVNQVPDSVSVHADGIPADVEAVLMRCLAKDPDQRPATAKAFRDELSACECAGDWSQSDAIKWWKDYAKTRTDIPRGAADTVISASIEV